MKKLIMILPVILAVILTGCNKDPGEVPDEIEISFAGVKNDQSSLKSNGTPLCQEYDAEYALVKINGTYYRPLVFYLNDALYTQSIKIPYQEGIDYTVEEFHLMDDGMTPSQTSDDIIIMSTPMTGSEFAQFVIQPLGFTIPLEPFQKNEVYIEVLCFEPDEWESFGFEWFRVGEVIVREQTIFGDLCVTDPNLYAGSLYEQQSNGLQIDMPAIFAVEVYRNGDYFYKYSNEEWLGEGDPLSVRYGDRINEVDDFEFRLLGLFKDGDEFNYKHIHTWTFQDDEMLTEGEDGVCEFAVGWCVQESDYMLGPYLDLPSTCVFTVLQVGNNGAITGSTMDGYVYADISLTPEGHLLYDGEWKSWSFDHKTVIHTNHAYSMNVYNSVYPGILPEDAMPEIWDEVNWLMNNLDLWPDFTWQDLQGAFWMLTEPPWDGLPFGGVPALGDLDYAQDMYDQAIASGAGFVPGPGEKAAVILMPEGSTTGPPPPELQVIFIEVE